MLYATVSLAIMSESEYFLVIVSEYEEECDKMSSVTLYASVFLAIMSESDLVHFLLEYDENECSVSCSVS